MVTIRPKHLTAEDIPASFYHFGLIRQYGPAMYGWEPETLWKEIEDDFFTTPSLEVKNKIQAICTINHIDSVFNDTTVFRSIALVLNHQDPEFEMAGGLYTPELAWALEEIARNSNASVSYGHEIVALSGVVLENDNFLKVPPEISKYIKNLNYKSHVDKEILEMPDVATQAEIRMKRVSAYVLSERDRLGKYLSEN